MYCEKCGALLRENARFCSVCGERVPKEREIVRPRAPKRRSAGKRWFVFAVMVALMITVSSGFSHLIGSEDDNFLLRLVDRCVFGYGQEQETEAPPEIVDEDLTERL